MCIRTSYENAVVGMISLVPTYSITWYENILFDICPLSRRHKQRIHFLHIMQIGAMNSHTNLLHLHGICRISKRNMLISPQKNV